MPSSSDVIVRPLNFPPSLDLGNATAEQQFANNAGGVLVLPLPSDGQLVNSRFRVHLGGRVQTISNLTFTLAVYFGSSTTFGGASPIASNTLMLTTNANTVNAKKTNYQLDMDLFWDDDSDSISGTWLGQIANSIIGASTLANTPTADADLHGDSNSFQGTHYGLTFTGLFSGSSTGNHAFLDVLSIELV